MKLGKRAARHDPRTLKFADYLITLPSILSASDWTRKVPSWGMLGNDSVGDCVYASKGHLEMLWTAYAQAQGFVPTTAQILADYSRDTGYNSADPNSDQGAVMLDAAKAFKAKGIAGHTISAFMKVDPQNWDHVRAAIMLFGHCDFGLALPIAADPEAPNPLAVWDTPDGQELSGDWAVGSLGGHCGPAVLYDGDMLKVVTWGALQPMTRRFMQAYADEAYCYLSPDFFNAAGNAPSGFDLAALQSDLNALS